MPLVSELANNNKNLNYVSSYSIAPKNEWNGKYWQFSIDIDEFKLKIKSQADIAELDASTKQSIFHYVLSHNLFEYPQEHSKQYHISKKDKQSILLSVYANQRTWKDYHDNYAKLLGEEKLKIVEQVAKDYKNQIFNALLAPYQNDDKALMRVLLTPDYLGNTPLFYAYKSKKLNEAISLFDHINKFSPQYKEQLLFAQNQDGRTILHVLIENYVSIESAGIAYFGQDAIRKALWIQDLKGNTPLHQVFFDTKTYLNMVTSICKLAKPQPQPLEEKELPLEKLFVQNAEGFNPLHLVCKCPPRSADDVQMLTEFLDVLPIELAISKIMETDQQECTPLHYAILGGQFSMADILFDFLKAQNQAITRINPKTSLLNYACQYGNCTIINRVIETLSLMELYQIVSEFSELEKKITSNTKLHQSQLQSLVKKLHELKDSNKLLNCFNYFESNFSTKSNFTLRFNDFCNCWTEIETNISKGCFVLPPEDPTFRAGLHTAAHFKRIEPYYVHRSALLHVTEREVNQFREFINLKAKFLRENPQQISPGVKLAQRLAGIKNPHILSPSAPQGSSPPPYPGQPFYEPTYLSIWRQVYGYEIPVAHPVHQLNRTL